MGHPVGSSTGRFDVGGQPLVTAPIRGRAGELRDFFQHHVRKIAAGYCEALPILVQQRPYADMKFAVGAQFSQQGVRHPVGRTK